MPEEVFIIIIFSIVSFTSLMITKMVLDHRREKGRARAGGDGGITTSELEALVKRAMEQAMRPLIARLDDLEERNLLPPAREPEPLSGDDRDAEREEQRVRRTRTA
ncbi:MAG: hypothetical protein D6746_15065 [Bacteroidetes bacterium]|nr:MAG: hypothetical protein D6746_15065 [Bacteroidota bacterium]